LPPVNLEQEAARITDELGRVVFVGAVAVNHYARFRESRDIDLVAASPIDEAKLLTLGYRRRAGSRSSWYSPRGIQCDFFTKDVGGIPVWWILETSVSVKAGKKTVRVMSLEGLILAKYRAGRTQDIADLRHLIGRRSPDIRWDVMSEIGTDQEVIELKQIAKAFEF